MPTLLPVFGAPSSRQTQISSSRAPLLFPRNTPGHDTQSVLLDSMRLLNVQLKFIDNASRTIEYILASVNSIVCTHA